MTGNQTAGFTGCEPEFHVGRQRFRKIPVPDYTIHLIQNDRNTQYSGKTSVARGCMRLFGSTVLLSVVLLARVPHSDAQTPEADVRPGATSSLPESPVFSPAATTLSNPTHNHAKGPVKSEWIFAPIPFSNQAFTFGLIPVVERVFAFDKQDTDSPPSTLILGGMIAQRKSWAFAGGGRLHLHRDRFRPTGFAGHGSITYEIFGTGNDDGEAGQSVLIHQGGDMVMGEFLVRLFSKFYAGPRYNYRNLTANLKPEAMNTPLPPGLNPEDLGVEFKTHGPGFKVVFDTRSSEFFPRRGGELQFVGDFFAADRGSSIAALNKSFNYQSYQLSKNHYFSFSERDILAVRGMICQVKGDDAPFYELCQFGLYSDIRGYQPGRFRDHLMFATQAEYRRIFSKRWGASAFFGLGEVAPAWDEFNYEDLLPGGGVGLRFNLAKQDRINLRADISYGETGWSWVFALGEAF